MYSIKELQQLLFEALEKEKLPDNPKELYEPIDYLLNLGGKRLRPALLLLAIDLFNGNVKKGIKPALAIEYFHNFSLMHDDIMDEAPLRRGKATVHQKWNEPIAILSGDMMLIKAYQFLTESVDPILLQQVLKVFNKTAIEVCEGQQMDMNFETLNQVGIDEYIEMIKLKTSVLLGGSLQIGALLANANEKDVDNIYEFGVNLGIAFQLQDDLLDVYGDPEKFGKQIGGDILANKKTFLLINAKNLAKNNIKNELEQLLSNNDKNKVEKVTNIYNQLDIPNLTKKAINLYADKGVNALNKIEISTERKLILTQFATNLINRDN